MRTFIRTLGIATLGALATMAHDASANPLDLNACSPSYPVEVITTSPSPHDSQFEFNATYAMALSDANFNIDANFNSDGTLNGFNSVTITTSLNTGYVMTGDPVYATFEWQSGSGANNAKMDALTGVVVYQLVFKLSFGGAWKGGTETCATGAFTVNMSTTGNTYPNSSPALTGIAYTSTSGSFQAVSSAFTIADIAGSSCTLPHKANLEANLSVGTTPAGSGMKIDLGYPVYACGGSVFGS